MTEGGRQDFSQHGASGVILRGPDSGAGSLEEDISSF